MDTHRPKKKKCTVEIFSRVCGYFQPVQRWNEGKRSEFHDRKCFDRTIADRAEKEKLGKRM